MSFFPRLPILAAFVLLGTAPLAAQSQQVYRCAGPSGVTYTHAPCTGGQALGTQRAVAPQREAPPPQDRARRMNRAQLPPEIRAQCGQLEREIRQAEARLKARRKAAGAAAASSDTPLPGEGDLAIQRVRYRELRC